MFKHWKQLYDETIIKWQRKKYGIKLAKSMFSAIIAQVWEELRRKQLRRGFLKAFCDFILPNEIFELAALKRFLASIVENPNTLLPPRTSLQILDAQRYCFN